MHMILLYILILLTCFVVLARIVDLFFIASLDKISKDLKLSGEAAGATLMAVGSSAPELFVALFAVLKPGEHGAIGIGSIVGSAIFNLLVIIGAAACAKTIKLTKAPLIRDLLFYTLTVVLLVFFIHDGNFSLLESGIFLGVYVVYVLAVVYWQRIFPYEDVKGDEKQHEQNEESNKIIRQLDRFLKFIFPREKNYYGVFAVSIILIAVLSYVLVEVAVVSAHILNVSETIIALIVLAVGTSVPDLFSSIIVAKQGRGDMAVSNAIGSNIFDILVGLGLPFMIVMLLSGDTIEAGGNITRSVIILLGAVVLLVILLFLGRWKVKKPVGILLILVYIAYVVFEIGTY